MANSKWQGSVEAKIMAPLDQVWKMVSEFYEAEKIFPGMKSCERVEGAPEKGVGSVRRCVIQLPSDQKISVCSEVVELIDQDDIKHCFTYRIKETNMEGFEGYEGTVELCETGEHDNCLLKWSFRMNPIVGLSKEDVEALISSVLADIVKNLEQLISLS